MPLPKSPHQPVPLGTPIGRDPTGKAINLDPTWLAYFQSLHSNVVLPLGGSANTQQGQFTANLTEHAGLTTLATATVQYRISGNFAVIFGPSMTSAGTVVGDMQLTGLPAIIQPVNTQGGMVIIEDNSAVVLGWFVVNPFGSGNAGQIFFNTIQLVTAAVGGEISPNPGAFKVGTKGLPTNFGLWSMTYPLT